MNRFRIALAVLSLGCGGAPSNDASPTAPRPAEGNAPFESPARWASFPDAVGAPTSTLVLGDGRCLVLTDDGQRWLVTPKDKAKPCAGRATASGSPSLESLLFVEKVPNGYRFVGEGGVVYESRDPIGPFERAARAPSYLLRLAAGGSTVVGVDRAGKTFHFEDGTWKPSQAPARVQGLDVAVDPSGKAAWLGAPETVLISSDGGRTFVPPASPPGAIGAWEVMRREDGKLGVLGLGGAFVLEGDKFVSAPVPRGTNENASAEIDPVRGPKESLVRSGVAALSGKTYYEIIDGEGDQGRFALLRAELGTAPETIPIAGHESCDALKIAADGNVVALACMSPGGSQRDLSLGLDVSIDRGKSYSRIAELSAQTFGDVHLAVAKSGDKGDLSVLVTGACRPDAEKKPEPQKPAKKDERPKAGRDRADRTPGACSPKAPVMVRRESGKVEIAEGAAAQVEQGSARSPALSPDGRVAYVLARTRRDGRRSLFVSRDGGRTYAQRKLEMIHGSGWDDADDSEAGAVESGMLSIPERAELTVDESGILGLLCDSANGPIWATLDSDGRVQSSGRPAEGSLQLGGFGSRVLAIGFGADDTLRAWESLDGGSSFAEIAVTQAVLRFANRGESSVACSAGGCVLGDELVRVGWEGQAEAPFEVTEESFSSPDVSLSAPLTCRLTPKTDWTRMGGRSEDGSAGPRMPRLRDVARGKTAWSALSIDASGKVDVFSAPMPERGTDGGRGGSAQSSAITTKPLLGAPQGKGTAMFVGPQAEGYVAMRAPVPKTKGGTVDTTAPIDRVDLAWHNQFLGVTARRTVRLDENWSPAMLNGEALRPVLVSITGSGVTVRANGKRATYFDAQSAATSFDYPVWPEVFADRRDATRGDVAMLGGSPVGVAFVDRAPLAQLFALARPRGQGRGFDLEARTIAPGYADLEWIYSGDRSGVAALSIGAGPERAEAWMISDRGLDTEPIPLARLGHAADRVTFCTTEKRRTTPRSVSAHFTRAAALIGTAGRRAVLITDATSGGGGSLGAPVMEPIWLLTDGAVMHGSPADPCIAAWRASGVRGGAVAVIAGDLEHAWLIKEAFDTEPASTKPSTKREPARPPRPTRVLLARPMSCKVDASMAVPHEVATRAGSRMPDDSP
ncbi:MAG: hypothetical protein HOV80_33910 [Polyangiaceae bacterium]|nr:hypothetical protein [Polyangiaceae bacterium]